MQDYIANYVLEYSFIIKEKVEKPINAKLLSGKLQDM